MSKIPILNLEFLAEISEDFKTLSSKNAKLNFLVEEKWHFFSTNWVNLILSITKTIFKIEEESPGEALREAMLKAPELSKDELALLTEFYNLIENWDDILGVGYYQLEDSIYNFVFVDTSKILKKLLKHVDDEQRLKKIISMYGSGRGKK